MELRLQIKGSEIFDRDNGKFPTPQMPKEDLFFESFKASDDTNKLLSRSFVDKVFSEDDNNQEDGETTDSAPSGIY